MGTFIASDYLADAVTGPWRYVVALVPLLPLAWALGALVLYIKEADELERRQILESLGIAVAVTAFFSVACGFLQGVGVPRLSAWWTWFVLMLSWAAARVACRAYYGR
ncbi:MAG TPA: hypothetical protein VNG31_08890 [Candidatus Baltobacteraceae bacterium]|nr:hypothetical protein [Candidatus Baltobacteraceae bacterium]